MSPHPIDYIAIGVAAGILFGTILGYSLHAREHHRKPADNCAELRGRIESVEHRCLLTRAECAEVNERVALLGARR